MKKIMFNDKYGLTTAVLEGRKTMTRRLVKSDNIASITTSDGAVHHVDKTFGSYHEYMDKDGKVWLAWSPYKVGEVVAVAQSYKSIFEESLNYVIPRYHWLDDHIDEKGYANKMFVKASEMPHKIRITDIKLEHLQDISDEDCLKEGILKKSDFPKKKSFPYYFAGGKHEWDNSFSTPRKAFAELIDKISGKGTWDSNPYVFVYEFELID